MEAKHAVMRHEGDHDWIAEVLPNKTEAEEWAQLFRERCEPDVTYTVVPLASVLTA